MYFVKDNFRMTFFVKIKGASGRWKLGARHSSKESANTHFLRLKKLGYTTKIEEKDTRKQDDARLYRRMMKSVRKKFPGLKVD